MLSARSSVELSLPDTIQTIQYKTSGFQNWGKTVTTHPAYTLYPKSTMELSHIVTWAKSIGKRVRVSAYKHTWNEVFAEDNDILVSLLSSEESDVLPAIHKPLDGSNAFQHIELVGQPFEENGNTKHLCKIGTATTNEQFRNWAVTHFKQGSTYSWTLPLNVILVENSIGGTNAMICHGAGLQNRTLPDLVTEIEFVNPLGELQKIGPEDGDLIKTAAGSFGQLGVVTDLTFKLDLMTHARMKPLKPRIALTIPPPAGFVLPDFVPKEIMHGVTPQQLQRATEDFITGAETNYYSEYFWFSLHSHGWVNAWNNDGDARESQVELSPFDIKAQEVEEYGLYISDADTLKLLPEKYQALLLSDAAMLNLPAGLEHTVPLIEALHFRRGIHNMPVQDMEFEIPVPVLANGKLDWSICQRAWWDAIVTVYEWLHDKNKVPMRLPLEMRIMGGSEMTMASQRGNAATCSIEVLTLAGDLVDKADWAHFMQAVLDKWSKYTDAEGHALNIRPHWAKRWQGLTMERQGEERLSIIQYLKEIYKEPIATFNHDLHRIAEKGGYRAEDFKVFSSPLLDQVFHGAPEPVTPAIEPVAPAPLIQDNNKLDELIRKTQMVHLAQERFLSDTHGIKVKKVKVKTLSKEMNPVTSSLLANSWFAQGRKIAQAKLLALEEGIKNKHDTEQEPLACHGKCTIL